jgi:hypothetical protein
VLFTIRERNRVLTPFRPRERENRSVSARSRSDDGCLSPTRREGRRSSHGSRRRISKDSSRRRERRCVASDDYPRSIDRSPRVRGSQYPTIFVPSRSRDRLSISGTPSQPAVSASEPCPFDGRDARLRPPPSGPFDTCGTGIRTSTTQYRRVTAVRSPNSLLVGSWSRDVR